MTELEELKSLIETTWRDEEMCSSACYGIDAFSKRWPYTFMVNDWDVWNESRKGLKGEVSKWLDEQGGPWDFYNLLGSWGLVGFKDPETAKRFQEKWS